MNKNKIRGIISLTIICIIIVCIPCNAIQASSYKINLKDNQLFYILPGNESVDYQIKLTSGTQIGQSITCTTSDVTKATVSNDGALTIKDAGTFKVEVIYNGEKITRTVQSLLRTDWTRVISIDKAQKITVAKNNIATYKIKNLMDFPLKVNLRYNTYNSNGNLMQSDVYHEPIFLAANETITYKELVSGDVKYISISSVTFDYNQYGLEKIDPKKVVVKESIAKSKKTKSMMVIKETVTNNNAKNILIPYQKYVYDKNGKITSLSYNCLKVLPKQKNIFSGKYYTKQPAGQLEYASKIVYKFFTPIPEF